MKRKIKFRGKDVRTSVWIYGVFHEHIDITPAAIYEDSESRENHIKNHTHYLIIQDAFSDYCMPRNIQCFEVTSETVGQFTGKVDKNKVEIYEEDIARVYERDRTFDIVVKWNTDAMAFMAYHADGNQAPLSWFANLSKCELEVIGNIHDNPEFIKQQ